MSAMIMRAQSIRSGDYVKRWRDTVANIQDNLDGTVTFTMTNDGTTHTVDQTESLRIE